MAHPRVGAARRGEACSSPGKEVPRWPSAASQDHGQGLACEPTFQLTLRVQYQSSHPRTLDQTKAHKLPSCYFCSGCDKQQDIWGNSQCLNRGVQGTSLWAKCACAAYGGFSSMSSRFAPQTRPHRKLSLGYQYIPTSVCYFLFLSLYFALFFSTSVPFAKS